MIVVRVAIFALGAAIVLYTLISAVRTVVLPRGARDELSGLVFRALRGSFELGLRATTTYEQRDRLMAFFAPVSLLLLLPTWLVLVALGYVLMYWATGYETLFDDLVISGSSLLTLGFARGNTLVQTLLAFSEATIGLMLVALLIAYLPTMYSAFQRREVAVTMLEVRAGAPPSAVEMIKRFHRLHQLADLHDLWGDWETWFAEIEESHTSLAALVFFRSPQPDHSWVTAAGAVLDAASLIRSSVDVPADVQADLCIRAGYLALRRIADFFNIPYNPAPSYPDDPISITREEYELACSELAEAGVPLKADRERAWRDFAGWRVNYDSPLLALARLTMAPYAPWSSDRSLVKAAAAPAGAGQGGHEGR
jgi:hypothetical protein